MSTTNFAFAKKLEDGTEITYSVNQWATDTLPVDELKVFNAAQDRQNVLVNAAIASGKLTITPYVVSDGNIMGCTVTTIEEITVDPEWLSFWDRFVADPTIIKK